MPTSTPPVKKKKEEKSTLYHKDGVIFVDMFRAPDDKHMKAFTPIVLPKGVTLTCSNCSQELKMKSEKYHSFYCVQCLRIYPDRPYNMADSDEKAELQGWTELIRPIIPSTKKPVTAEEIAVSSEELEKLKNDAKEVQDGLEDIL